MRTEGIVKPYKQMPYHEYIVEVLAPDDRGEGLISLNCVFLWRV
ncbi:MAG: hypothetical protein RMJ66_07820 [Bacteroidia bacterium]|nr:hypothetical protein [Bacteroidia bacterium]